MTSRRYISLFLFKPLGRAARQPSDAIVTRAKVTLSSLVLLVCCVHGVNLWAANGSESSHPGADVYLKFCAGCHGFDGFSRYEFAPSFALGDRLHKSDDELLRSVLAGRHAMPYWQNKLSIDKYRSAIAYLRVMAQRYRSGQPPRTQSLPGMHYKFSPVGEDEDYWLYRDY